jgi:predicted DNA-binding transcriptional regulator AlpA
MTHPMKLCTFVELKSIYGIMFCRQHIWRLEQLGTFPIRVPAGNCRIGWLCVEVEAWLAKRIASRRT